VDEPLTRRRWAKIGRYSAYCLVALAALVVAAALIVPEFLDRPAVEAEIQRKLSQAVNGQVTWDKLQVRLLPTPRGVLRGARIDMPETPSIRAEAIEVRLYLLPLLRGSAEIASVSVSRPELRIALAPPARNKAAKGAAADPLADYRSTARRLAQVVQKFAPDTVIEIEDAAVDVRARGMPPVDLRGLSLRVRTGARGMDLEAAAAGNFFSRVKLSARIEFADLSGKADVEVAGLEVRQWLEKSFGDASGSRIPAIDFRAQARTDAQTLVEGEFAIALAGNRLTKATLRHSFKDGSTVAGADFDIDLAGTMALVRRLLPKDDRAALAVIESIGGRARGRVKLSFKGEDWSTRVEVLNSDAAVQLRQWPAPVKIASGSVDVDPRAVRIVRAELAMQDGRALIKTLGIPLGRGATEGDVGFDLDLAQALELTRGLLPEGKKSSLAVIQSIGGRAQGNTRFAFGRKDWSARVEILKSDASVQLRDAPAPLGLAGGSVDIGPDAIKVDGAALSLLDANLVASAKIGYDKQLRAEGSISEGKVGEKFLAWVWQLAHVPQNLEPKAPIRIAAQRVVWGPKQALDLDATAQFDAGPGIALALGWAPGTLDIRRFSVKDERSNASLALRTKGLLLDGKFSGSLDSKSISNMLKNTGVLSGSVAGELRFTVDRDHPERTTAEGTLKGESFDLTWLAGRPFKVDRIDLAADSAGLRIKAASVNWSEQHVTLQGQIKRGPAGPIIDAQLESPGVVVDALFPPAEKSTQEKPPAAERQPPGDRESKLWPLPFTGRIAVHSGFVKYGSLELMPVVATLALEEEHARLDLAQGQLCGISMPLTVDATPQGFSVTARLSAQKQEIRRTANCLSDAGILITGNYDFTAELKTQGKAADLLRNVQGAVKIAITDGKVQKFALLGNILSMENIAALLKQGGPRLDDKGFPYRTITVIGHFEAGRFVVDESAFRSDALGLAATGWVSILDYDSRLSVLVAPLDRLDELMRMVPIVGYVIGGTLTSVPVSVSGDIRDPRVLPLGPEAVTSELVGIFSRTLKLPAELFAPLKARSAPADSPGQ
jgi:uncharacterized protein involved in outer membrane biogenesis